MPLCGVKRGWCLAVPRPIYVLKETMAGLVVGFAQIPESLAFALLANLDAAVGLHGAWIECSVCTVMGGRPGLVNSVSGAAAATMKTWVTKKCDDSGKNCVREGEEMVYMVTLLVGIGHVITGMLQITYLAQLISSPVMIGFSNGLAIIIGISQLHFFEDPNTHAFTYGLRALYQVAICLIAMLVIVLFPLIPKAGPLIPSALVALSMSVFLEQVFVRIILGSDTPQLGDIAPFTAENAFPSMPFFNLDYNFAGLFSDFTKITSLLVNVLMVYIVTICESLMSVEIVSEIMRDPGNGDQEVVGMGFGNMASGFCGGMPADASIALSIMNLQAGGRGKEGPFISAVVTFLLIAVGYTVLNFIPTAGLAGVMFMVVIHTFKWFSLPVVISSFLPHKIRKKSRFLTQKIKRWDAVIIIVVTVLTAVSNLAISVMVGVFLSTTVFTWESVKRVHANTGHFTDTKYYELSGPVFFASKKRVENFFDFENDPNNVVIVFRGSGLYDYSSLEVLNGIKMRYRELGKTVRIRGLKENCKKMLTKAGHLLKNIDMSLVEIEIPAARNMMLPSGVEISMEPLNKNLINKADKYTIPQDAITKEKDVEAATQPVYSNDDSVENQLNNLSYDDVALELSEQNDNNNNNNNNSGGYPNLGT
eukprot:GHVR01053491.1.p1 GENE.GHVR01053491.1~~GHVR01053491.1.p1  ORF type:complete len:648 (-),score=127.88 GHVR01053491.1:59-2002(-)